MENSKSASTPVTPGIKLIKNVARFCSKPTMEHWVDVKRIFRYLRGTVSYGLQYTKDGDNAAILTGYSDADWAGDINDRKSTSGYLFVISGAVVSWKSRKQTCVALSTAEAEYVALAGATQEAALMRQLMNDLCHEQVGSTVIYEDNQAAIAISQQPHSHSKMKHII